MQNAQALSQPSEIFRYAVYPGDELNLRRLRVVDVVRIRDDLPGRRLRREQVPYLRVRRRPEEVIHLGSSFASSAPYRWGRHPVTTSTLHAPVFLCSASSRTAFTDSCFAGPMNAHVLTTMTSAALGSETSR